MASGRQSTRIALRPAKPTDCDINTHPDGTKGPREFTLFPRIPLEVQKAIWSLACMAQQKEKRFLMVAPDTTPDELERENLDDHQDPGAEIRLRIYYEKLKDNCVPSILHACSYSRNLALKSCTLFPCGDFDPEKALHNKFMYVNLDEDTFFFGDVCPVYFEALRTLVRLAQIRTTPQGSELAHGSELGLIRRIQNIAFDWESYSQIMDTEPSWLLGVNPNRIIVNIRNPIREYKYSPFSHKHKMREVKPGTVRMTLAECILIWTNWLVAIVQDVEKPGYKPPTFEVQDLSDKDTEENSRLDTAILNDLVKVVATSILYL